MGAMEKSTHTREYRELRSELHRVRQDANLSQRALATRLGMPHSWVAKVENGERRIDLIEFCWFVSACGADPVAILETLLQRPKAFRAASHGKAFRSK